MATEPMALFVMATAFALETLKIWNYITPLPCLKQMMRVLR